MASNKFDGGKYKGGAEAKAHLRHNDCSTEMRAIAARGNPDIDPAKSHLNVNLTGTTYAQRCARYDARIAELDAMPGANKRKDRVTAQGIETPVPPGLDRDKYNDFLTRVMEISRDMFGEENLVSADIHWDEEHEYTVPVTKEKVMSRVHLQQVFIPAVGDRLCGKEFFSRKNMRRLNNAVQKMARDEFGVEFMDGSGSKGTKSVAELKSESLIADAEAQADKIQRAAAFKAGLVRNEVDARQRELDGREEDLTVREQSVQQREADVEKREQQVAAWDMEVGVRETFVKSLERGIEDTRKAAEDRAKEIIAQADEDALKRLRMAEEREKEAEQQRVDAARVIDAEYARLEQVAREVDRAADAAKRTEDAAAEKLRAVTAREQSVQQREADVERREQQMSREISAGRRVLADQVSAGVRERQADAILRGLGR